MPRDRVIDGKDIRSLLLDEPSSPSPHLAYYYYFMSHLTGVRSGRWKLHVARMGGRYRDRGAAPVSELYDLHADIGESQDVSAEYPQVVARLSALADVARADLGDGTQAGRNTRPPGFVQDAATLTRNQD